MSVLTLVQRALPFSLPWKRRHSTSKGKEKEVEATTHEAHEDGLQSGNEDAEYPSTTLPCDVFDTVHIAVRQCPDPSVMLDDSSSETSGTNSDSESEYLVDQISYTNSPSARAQLSRLVSWASIVRNRHRWTNKQEKELTNARLQLARCQKAWSSEQELWLDYVRIVSSSSELPIRAVPNWMTSQSVTTITENIF